MTPSIITMRLLFLLLIACGAFSCYSQQSNLQDRIKAVENNLAPDMIFGDTIPQLNLLKQMETYGINGLSIAVIKDYKLDWAKGYGWADREEKRAVTINT